MITRKYRFRSYNNIVIVEESHNDQSFSQIFSGTIEEAENWRVELKVAIDKSKENRDTALEQKLKDLKRNKLVLEQEIAQLQNTLDVNKKVKDDKLTPQAESRIRI